MAMPVNLDMNLVRQRLAVLQRLERSLADSESAILKMDASRIEADTEEQRELCLEWQALDARILALRERAEPDRTRPAEERWRGLGEEMERVEAELRQRNRLHAALLRRMRRSLVWLETLMRDPARTYSAPRRQEGYGVD